MTVGGSAKTGHSIKLQQESAIRDVFGTDDDRLANSLLSHCLKPLSKHETDGDNGNGIVDAEYRETGEGNGSGNSKTTGPEESGPETIGSEIPGS